MEDLVPDPLEVLAALGITGVASAARVRGGYDALIWRVEAGGQVYALRLLRPEQAGACQREVVALQAAAAGGVPVPAVHARGVWQGRPALLLTWLPGRTLLLAFGLHPGRIWRLAKAFGRTQAAIHAVPTPPEWRERHWISLAGPEEEPLQRLLRRLPSGPNALLHMDYQPLNVMAEGDRVTGVLDWPNAIGGDPRADLARTAALFRLVSMLPGLPVWKRVLVPLVQLAWQRGYQQAAGKVSGMAPFYAWAGAMTIRDLSGEREQMPAGVPANFLDPLRRWTAAWKQRAGVG